MSERMSGPMEQSISPMEVPAPYRRDKADYNREGEKQALETEWSQAQLALFRSDVESVMVKSGYDVRDWVEGDPRSYNNRPADRIATLENDDAKYTIVFTLRDPRSNSVRLYKEQNGTKSTLLASGDISANTIFYELPGSRSFDETDEAKRLINWKQYAEWSV